MHKRFWATFMIGWGLAILFAYMTFTHWIIVVGIIFFMVSHARDLSKLLDRYEYLDAFRTMVVALLIFFFAILAVRLGILRIYENLLMDAVAAAVCLVFIYIASVAFGTFVLAPYERILRISDWFTKESR